MRALFAGLAAPMFDPWSTASAQDMRREGVAPKPSIAPPSAPPSPSGAAASTPSEIASAAPSPPRTQGLVWDGWLGGGASSLVKGYDGAGVFAFGSTGLYHNSWLEMGSGVTVQLAPFGPFASTVLGGLVGLKSDDTDVHSRYELLAEVGADFVDVGGGLFVNSVDHGSATLPYLGARGAFSFLLGRSHRFVLGVWASAGDAVGTTVVHPVVTTCLLGCSTETETYTIGGFSWTIGLRIGGEAAQW
jgi:hypothetical protein